MSTLRRIRVAVSALMAITITALTLSVLPAKAADLISNVIIQKAPGSGLAAEKAVKLAGGSITDDLSIIDGFAAKVPTAALPLLRGADGVRWVSNDDIAHMQSDPATTSEDASQAYKAEIGSASLNSAGVTGKGVTVALIDTGVSALPQLSANMVDVKKPNGGSKACVDLSGENSCNDSYGHGTFIAGLITGAGENGGVAPDANVLSVKIAGADGSAPVSKILFAIQWVVSHKAQYGIDVLNLSLGTDSTQSYLTDPFNFAVEKAWQSGIAVVVSAGNRGAGERTISKPADDPFVITVGAVDDKGTSDVSDDILPNFTSRGPTASDGLTKPDIAAPGSHLVSLRSPGSSIEQQFPGTGVDATYRRGSGTSMSAGVISGSIALLLEAKPQLSPDEIKYALTNSAQAAASTDPNQIGSGLVDIQSAVTNTPVGQANRNVVASSGTGSLDRSQGSLNFNVQKSVGGLLGLISDLLHHVLIGDLRKGDSSSDPSGGSWYGTSWYGGSWYGGSWYGGSWYGQPTGGSWYGGSWYGGSWYGAWD